MVIFLAALVLDSRQAQVQTDPDVAFVDELAAWCGEMTRENPNLTLGELLARVYQRGAESEHAGRFVDSILILDSRDKPMRHSVRNGGFEWRGAGRDGEFYTPDDVVAAYRLGEE